MAYIGEIKLWAGTYAPQGWAFCAGQLLSIAQNSFLYSQIGTTYGGDGINTFALPDLRGRVPIHHSPSYPTGMMSGTETVSLLASQLPQHTHAVNCATAASANAPSGNVWSDNSALQSAPYSTGGSNALMAANSIGPSGQGAPHENMMPFQAINYIISLEQNFDDTPYICEVRPFAFGRMPKGWGPCAGALLAIQSNTALFALIGTIYGGNGVSTFGLPNLVGQAPVGAGAGPGLTPRALGETGGTESVTLTLSQLAQHTHLANCSTAQGDSPQAHNHIWSEDSEPFTKYASGTGAAMAANAIGPAGGNSAHENRQPYVAVSYGIALQGIFPPRG